MDRSAVFVTRLSESPLVMYLTNRVKPDRALAEISVISSLVSEGRESPLSLLSSVIRIADETLDPQKAVSILYRQLHEQDSGQLGLPLSKQRLAIRALVRSNGRLIGGTLTRQDIYTLQPLLSRAQRGMANKRYKGNKDCRLVLVDVRLNHARDSVDFIFEQR